MILAAVGVIFPLVLLVSLAIDYPATSRQARLGAALAAILMGYFTVFRLARARVCVLRDGVKVVNPLRTVFVPWHRISRFSLRTWGLFYTPIGHVDLKDGSSVHILGIGAPNPGTRPRNQSAQRLIEELNDMLTKVRSGDFPLT